MEEMHRPRCVGRHGFLCPPQVRYSPRTSVCSSTQKLSKAYLLGLYEQFPQAQLIKALVVGDWNQALAPLPPWNWQEGWSFKMFSPLILQFVLCGSLTLLGCFPKVCLYRNKDTLTCLITEDPGLWEFLKTNNSVAVCLQCYRPMGFVATRLSVQQGIQASSGCICHVYPEDPQAPGSPRSPWVILPMSHWKTV